jgi:Uma2 family endonuclease
MSTAILPAFYSRQPYTKERLPESDGKPMAETDKHRKQMIALLEALEEYYRPDPRIYVSGNILVHYRDEASDWKFLAPDVLVVKDVEKKERGSYIIEDEGKAPDSIIELVSPSSKVEDLGNKRVIYAGWGVKEYFLFDPTGELFSGPLRGFRLEGNDYVPMMGARLHSEVLGLDLVVERGRLRLYDPKTGKYLLTHEESEAARRKAEAKAANAEAKAANAEAKAAQEYTARREAEAKAAQEYAAREAAEAELVRLREELAKLRGQKVG